MKRLILASLAVAATLASCTKESEVGTTTTTTTVGNEITFAPYAGASLTKGTTIDSNKDFYTEHGAFLVSADFQATTGDNSGQFFSGLTVNYTNGAWENATDMYWPNESGTVYFGATAPTSVASSISYNTTDSEIAFTFDHTVAADTYATSNTTSTKGAVADHEDVMYAVTSRTLTSTTSGDEEEELGTEDNVTLHFKHALTQIAFTATKDDDISVEVSEIQICNVIDGGTFTASVVTDDDNVSIDSDEDNVNDTTDADNVSTSTGTWTTSTGTQGHYKAALDLDSDNGQTSISVTDALAAVALTDEEDALMLIPQELEAWDTDQTAKATSAGSFLAIKCVIKHAPQGEDDDAVENEAAIVNGYVFVPFNTDAIEYETGEDAEDGWLPGYKLTYNLHFGGGYTIPDGGDVPDPGDEPDPEEVVTTLRAITYTTTVDEWVPVDSIDITDTATE